MVVSDYVTLLQNALPVGLAWARAATSFVTQLLSGIALEFARIDARALDMIRESDPRETTELIDEWEAFAGLPDPCVTTEQTLEQRRVAVCSKLLMQGGQSIPYFLSIAQNLGYEGATIDDQFEMMDCNSDCDAELHSADDIFFWQLNLPSDGAFYEMDCNSPCDESLASWGDEAIECRINRYKPAHTNVAFAYI